MLTPNTSTHFINAFVPALQSWAGLLLTLVHDDTASTDFSQLYSHWLKHPIFLCLNYQNITYKAFCDASPIPIWFLSFHTDARTHTHSLTHSLSLSRVYQVLFFVWAFTKPQNPPTTFVMSARIISAARNGRIYVEIDIGGFMKKSVEKLQVQLKSVTLHDDLSAFYGCPATVKAAINALSSNETVLGD